MGFILLSLVSLTVLVHVYAKPSKLDEEWTYVPDRNGLMIRVNITETMPIFQPYFDVEDDVSFELYTLDNPSKPQYLVRDDIHSISSSNFDKNKPTRIYIHGWQEYAGNMKKTFNTAFLNKARKDVNLIYVNWEKCSHTVNYIQARNRVPQIGTYVASMIDFMVYNKLVELNDITVIGFSLGAHAAGIAGKMVQSGQLPKIVGLDPAGPLFHMEKPEERLDKTDAQYVEVVHTSGKWIGFYEAIGHVNFYPNRGLSQVGCSLDPTGTCSHLRAFKYFAESIYSKVPFESFPCKSVEDMQNRKCGGSKLNMGGEPGNYNAGTGIYYLQTNSKAIFARGGF